MRFALFAAVLAALMLTACGDPKPGQYPPSIMMERESMPDKGEDKNKKIDSISKPPFFTEGGFLLE